MNKGLNAIFSRLVPKQHGRYSPINIHVGASRVAQWLRVLYCSASCATRDSGFAPRLCRNRPRPGGPWGVVRLGRVWPVGKALSHRAPATPVAGRALCVLTKVARCTVFPPTHRCGWLPGQAGGCFLKCIYLFHLYLTR